MIIIDKISGFLQRQTWYESWRRKFWSKPNRLYALRVAFTVAVLCVPAILMGECYVATTLALGVLAGALSETDDHPRGRVVALVFKTLAFAISSLAVGVLQNNVVLLGVGLGVSTIIFILIGGIGERFKGITFSSILVGIYAMISIDQATTWYLPSILLTVGALFQGLFSLILLYMKPYRLLEEQLARGFEALSVYQKQKAKLFLSDSKLHPELRNKLSTYNVKLVECLDKCRVVMRSYADIEGDNEQMRKYLSYFMLLQSLHERTASTHERYELINRATQKQEMLEGIGQAIYHLGEASNLFAYSLLVEIQYKNINTLGWIIKVLEEKQKNNGVEDEDTIGSMVSNLSRSNEIMESLANVNLESVMPRLSKDYSSYWECFKEQISFQHPRMRYAVRLALSLVISYSISEYFKLEQGEWIVLTSLMVCQPSYSETRKRFFERVMGTIIGVVLGMLVIQILPTTMGKIIFLLSSAYLFFYWLRQKYSIAVIFITTYVLCTISITSQEEVIMMGSRLIDTIIGAIISIAAVRLLWPDWQYRRIPNLLNQAFIKNAAYLERIIYAHKYQLPENDYEYRVVRREAHRADNALALAWQNMRLDPEKQRSMHERSFKLTYLNHALISYLSALGLYRENGHLKKANLLDIASQICETIKVLQLPISANIETTKKNLIKIIIHLKELKDKTTDPIVKQQSQILQNIAELSLKLFERANNFDKEINPS